MKYRHNVVYPKSLSSFEYEVLPYICIILKDGLSEKRRVAHIAEKSRNFQKMKQANSSMANGLVFWPSVFHIGILLIWIHCLI